MSEILLCNQPVKADFLNSACGIDANFIHGRNCSTGVSWLDLHGPVKALPGGRNSGNRL
ncbi:hypothetical protein [uncultured Desulfobacter sp.]|uniref:hypothetical protein n=1 Tax=uncultured Desulfobacter sp. TaxID=240139 RepID=UPI0029F57861|nr:hypothetical protein [uncultured Desulfobacter sp.]